MNTDWKERRAQWRSDNDMRFCPACDAQIEEVIRCEVCGRRGCVECLIQDPDTGERRCEENCERQMR